MRDSSTQQKAAVTDQLAELRRLAARYGVPLDIIDRLTLLPREVARTTGLKLVSEELGHATTRMVMETYDSFVGPDAWPEAAEIDSLRAIYGWADLQLDRAPSGPWRAQASFTPSIDSSTLQHKALQHNA